MSSISFLYLIFASGRRRSRAKKTSKSQLSTVWRSFLFKYFLRSCLSFSRPFFSTFWSFSSVSLFVFRSSHLFSSLHLRTRDASRLSSCQKISSLSFMASFPTDFSLLIHRIFLSCSSSCSISSWFVRNFLRTHQVRSGCLPTSRRPCSLHLDDLNE